MDEESKKYKVKIRGIRPLLPHSADSMLENDNNSRARTTTPEEECEKSLYRDPAGNICIPARVIEAALIKASTAYRVPGKGKKTFKDFVKGGVFVHPSYIPLNSDWVVDIQTVVVRGGRIPRARPRFDEWELEFEVEVTDPIIQEHNIKDFVTAAGKYCGLCDYRPRYGRFEVVKFEKIDD